VARAALAVGALVVLALVGYGALSTFVAAPRVFGDEVIYLDAGDSLADGHGLRVQDHAYGRGPGYPATIAPIASITQDRSAVYFWAKLANALWFALSAIPIYLLARRLLSRRWSLGVAALSLLIPSSIYIGLVMTDSLAYLVGLFALYAIVLAVERPTWQRQLGVPLAVGLAYLVRPQFAVLYPAYLLAGVAAERRRLRDLWVSAAVTVAGLAALGTFVAVDGSATLGDYAFLWRSYDLDGVARMVDYHYAELGLYLGLIPLLLLPAVIAVLYRRARAGSAAHRAFLVVFVATTLLALLVAAVFASSPSSQGRLYDRYVFYVVPLWLIAGAAWLREGAPLPRRAVLIGTTVSLGALAALPFDVYVVDDASKELHAAGTPIWTNLGDLAVAHGQTGHRAIFVVTAIAAALVLLTPRRRSWALALPVVAVFVANSFLLWSHGIEDNNGDVFGSDTAAARSWIDRVVPGDESVTMLDIQPSCQRRLSYAYLLTEFFNDRVDSMSQVGVPAYGGLPKDTVDVNDAGRLVQSDGRILRARWIVAPSGVKVFGRPVAEGTVDHLVLWHVPDGDVELAARSNAQAAAQACNSA
jgi:Dolichyl-phosphate-mannose-protein mannosyltransferase